MKPPHLSRAASWSAAALLSAIPTLCLAVDRTSLAYCNGGVVARAFLVLFVLAVLVRLLKRTSWAKPLGLLGAAITVGVTAWVLVQPGHARVARLDEPSIRQFIDAGMRAAAARDTFALCAQLADDAQVNLVRVRFSGSEVRSYGKPQYCEFIAQGYAAAEPGVNVHSSFQLHGIDVAEDGRSAEVRGEAVEELSLKGRTVMRMTSQQSATVQLTDGRLQYTSVTTRLTGGQ